MCNTFNLDSYKVEKSTKQNYQLCDFFSFTFYASLYILTYCCRDCTVLTQSGCGVDKFLLIVMKDLGLDEEVNYYNLEPL